MSGKDTLKAHYQSVRRLILYIHDMHVGMVQFSNPVDCMFWLYTILKGSHSWKHWDSLHQHRLSEHNCLHLYHVMTSLVDTLLPTLLCWVSSAVYSHYTVSTDSLEKSGLKGGLVAHLCCMYVSQIWKIDSSCHLCSVCFDSSRFTCVSPNYHAMCFHVYMIMHVKVAHKSNQTDLGALKQQLYNFWMVQESMCE